MTAPARTRAAQDAQARTDRRLAFAAGVLFILTFVTSIIPALLYAPAIDNPNYILGAGADSQIQFAAFLETMLVLTNIGTGIALFPILRRHSEVGALSFFASRILECVLIAIGLLALLALTTVRQHPAGIDGGSLFGIGETLVAVNRWTFTLGPGFVVGFGNGIVLGYLFWKTQLVPRKMAILGLLGGPGVAITGAAVVMGLIERGSILQGVATIPEFFWELFLGIWLTFKGVNAARAAATTSAEPAPAPAYAAA